MKERYRSIVDVHIVLWRDGLVLLGERANTGFGDGCLNLPSGHLEEGESVIDGAIREAKEEIGITVAPQDLRFAHVMHHRGDSGSSRVGFFFEAVHWEGVPVNMEPAKCAGLVWADPKCLPSNTIPYQAAGVVNCHQGESFALDGWS
ncbi:NUDIX hydrolase [Nocardia sp. CA-128927]|uniref:NUDIX hydrolase n=1 Tax=Nocardia sp. CA-128927 TaxID=3239975 RepID=UPI003D96782B